MTDQKSSHPVPVAPLATNYEINMHVKQSGDRYFGDQVGAGTLSCTTCSTVLRDQLGTWVLDGDQHGDWVQQKVTRHNIEKHPELVHVLTPIGWCTAGQLYPMTIVYKEDALARFEHDSQQ